MQLLVCLSAELEVPAERINLMLTILQSDSVLLDLLECSIISVCAAKVDPSEERAKY